jgi:hypothetical protein
MLQYADRQITARQPGAWTQIPQWCVGFHYKRRRPPAASPLKDDRGSCSPRQDRPE